MKKYVICAGITLCSLGSAYSYQQQGFQTYQEQAGLITHTCTQQCAIILGPKGNNNLVKVSGATGTGNIIIGVLDAQNQLFPISTTPAGGDISTLVDTLYGQPIPEQSVIVVLFQGTISMQQGVVDFLIAGLGIRMAQRWTNFWQFDSFKPYTINLLNGPMSGGKSANGVFLRLFIIGGAIIIIRYGQKRIQVRRALLILGLGLRIIYDVRMGSEMIGYYKHDYKNYITATQSDKIFRDRGDFYRFVDFVADELGKNGTYSGETIAFMTDISRPFPGSMSYFLYPYHIVYNYTGSAKTTIVYKSSLLTLDGDALVSGGIAQSGTIKKFNDYAFILFQ